MLKSRIALGLLSLNCLREYQASLGIFKPRDGLGNYGETVRTLRFGLFHRNRDIQVATLVNNYS